MPNPSFEDKEYCPNGNIYKAAAWFAPTYGSPDIFQNWSNGGSCYENCNWVGVVPYSYMGVFQTPHTGVAFVGMATVGSWSGAEREYISVKLSDTLKAGRKYCVSFYTCLSGYSGLAIDKIGVFFSVASPLDCAPAEIISSNGIANASGNVILDTLNWVLVSDTFVASGGELYLTIGNFQNYVDLQIDSTGFPQTPMQSYHLFDDISVVYCDSIIEPTPTPPFYSEITLFPNLSNGEFNISGNFPEGTQFEVYNMLGQRVYYDELQSGNQLQTFYLTLAEGAYIYRVQSSGATLKSGKLVLTR